MLANQKTTRVPNYVLRYENISYKKQQNNIPTYVVLKMARRTHMPDSGSRDPLGSLPRTSTAPATIRLAPPRQSGMFTPFNTLTHLSSTRPPRQNRRALRPPRQRQLHPARAGAPRHVPNPQTCRYKQPLKKSDKAVPRDKAWRLNQLSTRDV